MKTRKTFSGLCLAVALTVGLAPTASAALVTSDTQPVLLFFPYDPSNTTGVVSFSKLQRVKPDGTKETFVLPSDKALVVTFIKIQVKAVDTSLTANADLRMGPYYSRMVSMTNGNAIYNDGLDPGIIIYPQGLTGNNFYSVNLKNDVIIPGQIQVSLIGYLVPMPS
jgi:hypothetical protein